MVKRRRIRKKSRLELLHQYYRYTGFYRFIFSTLRRTVVPIVALILMIVVVNMFIFDLNLFLQTATDTYSSFLVYTIFFISESFLGLIPPEVFIAWADKTPKPWVSLTGLSVLSYMGGSVSYYIGRLVLSIPAVTRYVRLQMAKHVRNLRRWGGLMIVVSAFLPLPFSIASMAAGLIEYDYRQYLFWALTRIIRFYLYALIVFKVVV
jgi:membrane protein YqaA with SNARE-associated domain